MGFPSPASDYIEDTLTVTKLCRVDANSKIVKTDSGYAILDMRFWICRYGHNLEISS